MPSVPFTDPRWSVLNPPEKEITISKDGSTLQMVSNPQTDLYRTPKWEKYTASVYGFKQSLGKEGLTVSVDVELDYKDLVGAAALPRPYSKGRCTTEEDADTSVFVVVSRRCYPETVLAARDPPRRSSRKLHCW